MKWENRRRSSNVEDRRGLRPAGIAIGGGGIVILLLLGLLFGADPLELLQQVETSQPAGYQEQAERQTDAHQEELKEFVSVVLADTEDTWNGIFRQGGADYREPKLVLFTDYVRSACGLTEAAVGPFYCPADEKVYIDLFFYDELQNKFRAPGDFAQAYVIAHEVGHHVQNLLGISSQVTQAQRAAGKRESNRLSVMLELQADCLAGVWAHHAHDERNILEQGDIEEAMNAAAQIGDDRMQKRSTGFVMPDSFTHGSSEQRARWFRTRLASGDVQSCNTFEAASL